MSRLALVQEGWNVYRDQHGVNHLPGPRPGTPYTACGVDAGAMTLRYHDPLWAGVWCTDCLREASEAARREGDAE
jgi:hypothetical protein